MAGLSTPAAHTCAQFNPRHRKDRRLTQTSQVNAQTSDRLHYSQAKVTRKGGKRLLKAEIQEAQMLGQPKNVRRDYTLPTDLGVFTQLPFLMIPSGFDVGLSGSLWAVCNLPSEANRHVAYCAPIVAKASSSSIG